MFQPYDTRLLTDTDADHRARNPPSLGGDDFAYGLGSPIIAPGAGFVDLVDRDPSGSGGRMVGIYHGAGIRSEQLHAASIGVEVGDEVAEGDILGRSGGSAYGSEHGVGYHIHGHFVVHGVRHGWLNYLASVGATTAGGTYTPVEQEDDMKFTRIQSEGRGIALIGPGYYRHLVSDEEVINSAPLVGLHINGNDRQFDLWVSMAIAGTSAASGVDLDVQARIIALAARATVSAEVSAQLLADGVAAELSERLAS